MDAVWAPVIAALGGGLIAAVATYFAGFSQWRRELKSTAAAREADRVAAHSQMITQLRRDLLAAFVDGRVALARRSAMQRTGMQQSPDFESVTDDMRKAAERVAMAGEQLAAEIGTADKQREAARLTDFTMKYFVVGEHTEEHDWRWDNRELPSMAGDTVVVMMNRLLA